MAKTFDAFSACPGCLQDTIAKSPPTLQAGIDSFAVQEPFLRDFAEASRRLRPVADTLAAKLPTINSALETGTPVLRRTPKMNDATAKVFDALYDLAKDPVTLLALKDLHTTFAVGRPLTEYVSPYQTVCNNGVYFLTGLSGHISEGVNNGTSEAVLVRTTAREQDNSFNDTLADRPADVPANEDPQTKVNAQGDHYDVLHWQQYGPATDAQGNADCQTGQTGYIDGPLNFAASKYPPANASADFDAAKAGGSHTSFDQNIPGLLGGSYVSRKLGINNLRDVP
jgi:hypothetical protein